ncbi:MAG: DUF58 domain-containing protein [Lachnospiraceae bacterium]|nr:DUF58 domain-containing protein [Lachnospiraceae bacterium]
MKAIVLLVLTVATGYLAGIYRSGTGMVVAVMEFLLGISMAIAVQITSRKLHIIFRGKEQRCVRGETTALSFVAENTGILPVWHFRAEVMQTGMDETKEHAKRLRYDGEINSRDRVTCQIQTTAPHCGLERFVLDKICVWDYLRFFRKKVRTNAEEILIPVFPGEAVMDIEVSDGESFFALGSNAEAVPVMGMDVQEVLQYNEYTPGDPVKNIHWKLSARSDEIWVKKLSREDERRVTVFANLYQNREMSAEEKDAYYEILQAMIKGLKRSFDSVYLYWIEPKSGGIRTHIIRSDKEMDVAFTALYEAGWAKSGSVDKDAFLREKKAKLGNRMIELDGELRIFCKDQPIRQFTTEAYGKELREGKVVIP